MDNRKNDFPLLLSKVRLGCMSKYYIAGYVETEELVTDNLECTKLLYEAMKSYALFGPQGHQDSDICKLRRCLDSNVDAIVTIWGPGDELRSSTQCYVPSVNQWYNLAPMLIPRFSHGAVACEGFIYTVGGVSLNGHLSSMERYDYRLVDSLLTEYKDPSYKSVLKLKTFSTMFSLILLKLKRNKECPFPGWYIRDGKHHSTGQTNLFLPLVGPVGAHDLRYYL